MGEDKQDIFSKFYFESEFSCMSNLHQCKIFGKFSISQCNIKLPTIYALLCMVETTGFIMVHTNTRETIPRSYIKYDMLWKIEQSYDCRREEKLTLSGFYIHMYINFTYAYVSIYIQTLKGPKNIDLEVS